MFVSTSDTFVSYKLYDIATHNARHEHLLSFDNWRPLAEEHREYIHIPYISIETRIIGLHFAADSMGLSSLIFFLLQSTNVTDGQTDDKQSQDHALH